MQKRAAFAGTASIISKNVLSGVPVAKVQQDITPEALEFQNRFAGSRVTIRIIIWKKRKRT